METKKYIMTLPLTGRALTRQNIKKMAGLLDIPKVPSNKTETRHLTITIYTDSYQEGTYKFNSRGPRFREIRGQLKTMGLMDNNSWFSLDKRCKYQYKKANGDSRIEITFEDTI